MQLKEANLIAFAPDGRKAAFLYARMLDRLVASVTEIVRACSESASVEENIATLPDRFRTLSRVSPETYCIYFDLLKAVQGQDLGSSLQLLRELHLSLQVPLPPFFSRWGDLPGSKARRYLAYVNVDPSTQVEFGDLSSSAFTEIRACAESALALLARVAPEIEAEIRSLLTQIVFVSSADGAKLRFDGATSFFCYGALFLNAMEHQTLVEMIDGLAHESAHALLFSLSFGEPFVTNPVDELHSSPLRSDPRPLDGTFHATYVSARIHYAHRRVLESGLLSMAEKRAANDALAASGTAFRDGLKTLEDHASLTPLGRDVICAAREYMGQQA